MYNFSHSIQDLYTFLYKDKVLYLLVSVLLYLERDVVFSVQLARILPAVPSIYPCARQQKFVKLVLPTPRKNVCACMGHKKDGVEFKCQIVNKNMAI
jgi:hypothetical protein